MNVYMREMIFTQVFTAKKNAYPFLTPLNIIFISFNFSSSSRKEIRPLLNQSSRKNMTRMILY